MNTRSLEFRLVAGYAGLLSVVFACVGAVMFFGLTRYLQTNLEDTLQRRARQIEEIFGSAGRQPQESAIIEEIKTRIAPELNSRFIRILRPDGSLLYLSGAPADRSFDPQTLSLQLRGTDRRPTQELLANGQRVLISTTALPSGTGLYTVQVGASQLQIQAVEYHLLIILLLMLPLLAGIAAGGGYLMVKRALKPVDHISRSAERITSHNLSERLPVTPTGDELERLSISVNRMIARLDDAFQNSRRFLADASHELRTPLTVVKGELQEIVGRRQISENDVREGIGSVLEEVERLARIVEGLFAVSRLDAGEAQREWVSFDLAELAATTADQMRLLAEDEGVSLACDTSQPVPAEGDRARLKQVVVNLLDNAIKYTPAGGSIALKVHSAEDHAVLEVVDNGIGIPAQALPHIFERFYRVDKARSRDLGGGAGLGLSIVRSICAAHGAEIDVQSVLGEGSRFKIKLPTAKDRAARGAFRFESLKATPTDLSASCR